MLIDHGFFLEFFRRFFLLWVTFDHPKIIRVPPLGYKKKIRKIVRMLIQIAQKKGFNALNTTQKTPILCKISFLRKSRKISSKWSNKVKVVKNEHFEQFFFIFSEMVICTELGFFAFIQCIKPLLLSYHNQHSANFFRFFTINGDLYDFGVVRSYPEWKKQSKKKN